MKFEKITPNPVPPPDEYKLVLNQEELIHLNNAMDLIMEHDFRIGEREANDSAIAFYSSLHSQLSLYDRTDDHSNSFKGI